MDGWMERHLLLAEICMELRVPFYWASPGTVLLDGRGAKEVVRVLIERGHGIVGMEGFEAGRFMHIALLDHIYTSGTGPWKDAQTALSEWSDAVWVHIVFDLKKS